MGHSENSPNRGARSTTGLSQEARKISNKQSDPTPNITRKTTTKKAQASRRKEVIKIRMEIIHRV